MAGIFGELFSGLCVPGTKARKIIENFGENSEEIREKIRDEKFKNPVKLKLKLRPKKITSRDGCFLLNFWAMGKGDQDQHKLRRRGSSRTHRRADFCSNSRLEVPGVLIRASKKLPQNALRLVIST